MKKITSRAENYSEWYLDIIDAADLAENSVTKGSMVIKPYGYSIWENFQKVLDKKIKDTGHKNAYFPLFIPKSLLTKEAKHVAGFAKETAIVTHHRLMEKDGEIVVDPDSRLSEELIVRPTSETIIYDSFSKWIHSWRDLPLLINQWANVVRWELRTRPFLRTTEFLWQEGHTAHATEEEAETEALKMLKEYQDFVENYLAIPVIAGRKTESEKFAGALHTYSIESMMQDGKALQTGTSHNLGQNFAQAFDVKFADKDGKEKFVWQTSWGVSTRMVGALIMTHSDDQGLIVPPAIAPVKIVIVPVYKTPEEADTVLKAAQALCVELKSIDENTHLDDRDYETPGSKFNEWEKKGIPIRIEIGPKDIANNSVVVVRRDTKEKNSIAISEVVENVKGLLVQMQKDLFAKALALRNEHTYQIDDYEEFKKHFETAAIPGFVYSHWCGDAVCEQQISDDLQVTTRCIPLDQKEESGKCIKCGKDSKKRIIFAKAY
ncbi:MAG: prolyl-tRNA synthetase [Candidatus Doudnabacteria bacterium]|nr:prolyl-tRNA synthetase [Candidatus Doudnabacteria bacterium]